ncbi:MAG: 16S rRNA (cytidine(1402)-2'-O)-methyltransferase [Acidobacteria bacterium]|nr:16S rRNA (cytidine(1402)-2'-O)-methyltransferase [Acidobacteriota bacterium]MYC81647.1 16S rRNA (cytidine(1402)-2'-O)-methyltransferase [Acidobacteriota bacterium]
MAGTLFVVATPIGNLEDITLRALRILREADLIACEDTRHTRKLLAHYRITTPTSSYHEHNEQQRTGWLVERLESGTDVALVSDAGTPSISDPGYRLVRAALERGVRVSPIPGACAIISALSISGRPTDSFAFLGFLPGRKAARRNRLQALRSESRTLLFFESPLRLASTLSDIDEILDSREVTVAREMTKVHEQLVTGTAAELASLFRSRRPKGETVVVVEKSSPETGAVSVSDRELDLRFEGLVDQGLSRKDAIKQLARELASPKRELYLRLLREKEPVDGKR